MSDFVNLHCHTEYSINRSSIRISDLCEKVKACGMNACAITDYNNLLGCIEFYTTCKKYDIKPIIGCEICVNHPGAGFDHTLVLLAQNMAGYHNLIKIVSNSCLEYGIYNPKVDIDLLKIYSEKLICLCA